MQENQPKPSQAPRFSILTLLLLMTIVAMGLALVALRRENDRTVETCEELLVMQTYLQEEVGHIEEEDESELYIRELENQIPCARRYKVSFPHGHYNIVAGDYLGGEFILKNLKKRHQSKTLFRMSCDMSIHVFNNPSGDPMFSVDIVDFNSGQSGGGYLKDYKININELTFTDDQHRQAAEWRILNQKPHGKLRTYKEGTKFIPLFILKQPSWSSGLLPNQISAKAEDGTFKAVEGIAFWIEPIPKNGSK